MISSYLAGATLDNFAGLVARVVENAKAASRGETLPKADTIVARDHKVPVA